ncbi:virulence protein [Butyricicoccus sp. Marseille-Q5471]|uniref:virulence protein n=1 Tax=Butyricicoccus sp. Marseille-Q5471 TaxID=3039493 RepID=UPI0024BC083D|nr:virulence protein [Butyricicoccus sp. Marseille-Q5471]
MEMRYNVTGSDRKRLVTAIAEFMACAATYKGAPTFAYEVDCFTIDKIGTVSFDDRNPQRAGSADSEKIEKLIEHLRELGFKAETEESADSLVLSYPRRDITDAALENLHLLVASKETLIKKALAVDALPIEVDDEKVSFPWFEGFPTPEEISAYAHFTGKLIGMAKTQKRVIAKEKKTENDKYAFRCFLLRLGFIGDEYKAARKILLKNLTGSGAFKSGNSKVQELVKRINADADLYDDVMSLQEKEETENDQ